MFIIEIQQIDTSPKKISLPWNLTPTNGWVIFWARCPGTSHGSTFLKTELASYSFCYPFGDLLFSRTVLEIVSHVLTYPGVKLAKS